MKYTVGSDKRRVIGAKKEIEEWAFIGLTGRRIDENTNPITLKMWSVKTYIIHELCKGLERRVEGDHCA